MMGALIKGPYAERLGLDPADLVHVSWMPCVAKKYEAQREEMTTWSPRLGRAVPDIDFVLTTREMGRWFRLNSRGRELERLQQPDNPLGESTGAGVIFGNTGGVMEAAVRTAHLLVTGKRLGGLELEAVRGLEGIKTAEV
ncbi:unnamed protein product, partial [Discosporangium mesarthrocarpum]